MGRSGLLRSALPFPFDLALLGGGDGLGVGEVGNEWVRRLERRVGDETELQSSGLDGLGPCRGSKLQSSRLDGPREEGQRGQVQMQKGQVNWTGWAREGEGEGIRDLSEEGVRLVGQAEEGGCLSQTLIAVYFVPVSNGSGCVEEKN